MKTHWGRTRVKTTEKLEEKKSKTGEFFNNLAIFGQFLQWKKKSLELLENLILAKNKVKFWLNSPLKKSRHVCKQSRSKLQTPYL